jgi:hypothetical protein
LKAHLHQYSKIKILKEVKNIRNKIILNLEIGGYKKGKTTNVFLSLVDSGSGMDKIQDPG